MSVYSKTLRHVDSKDFVKTHQRRIDEQKVLRKIEREQQLQERKEVEEIKKLATPLKYDWRSDIFPQEEDPKQIKVVEEIKVNVPEKLKSNWREEFYSVEPEVKVGEQKEEDEVIEVPEHLKNNWRKELIEGMSTKDFEYLYGLSIHTLQINSVLGNVENINAQEIVKSSAQTTDYQFGVNFPGSYINSIGDNQIVSQSKVDTLAYLDTTYGNVSGDHTSFRLTTGPEGLPPEGQSPPGSVTPRVNLETALGVTLPAGVPNGNLGGTPIEGSAIKRVFADAKPGKRINFNWSFASSEDALGAATVDDYAFVAIKGQVTKLVSVLTKGLIYNGQFIYTVKPEDIVNDQVEIGIGIMDVFDPYVQTTFNITNFGTFWDAGTLGSTTDAADLGMSVAAATPQSQQKKEAEKEKTQQQQQQTQVEFEKSIQQYQSSLNDFEKAFGGFEKQITSTIEKASTLKSFNNIVQGKEPAFAVGALEGMDSAKQSEVLKALGPKASATFNQIQQYKELNQKLSQSKNPADWDKAVQVSGSIQQLYDKFGKEMKGEIGKAVSLPPDLNQNKFAEIGKKIAELKASAKQSEIDARNNQLAAVATGVVAIAGLAVIAELGLAALISSTSAVVPSAAARVATALDALKKSADAAKAARAAAARSMGQNSKGTGMGDRWSGPQFNSYELQGEIILEKKMKTFKQFTQELYPGQPSPNGFPDAPPPEMVNGYHPDYGKKSNMYNTLDKESAMSMPLTGDPEIDAKILKARKQPK